MITKYRAYCLSMIDYSGVCILYLTCSVPERLLDSTRVDSLDCEIASVKSVGKIILKIRRLIAGTSPCPTANHHHGGAQDD